MLTEIHTVKTYYHTLNDALNPLKSTIQIMKLAIYRLIVSIQTMVRYLLIVKLGNLGLRSGTYAMKWGNLGLRLATRAVKWGNLGLRSGAHLMKLASPDLKLLY